MWPAYITLTSRLRTSHFSEHEYRSLTKNLLWNDGERVEGVLSLFLPLSQSSYQSAISPVYVSQITVGISLLQRFRE
jgi:hypothetical protein